VGQIKSFFKQIYVTIKLITSFKYKSKMDKDNILTYKLITSGVGLDPNVEIKIDIYEVTYPDGISAGYRARTILEDRVTEIVTNGTGLNKARKKFRKILTLKREYEGRLAKMPVEKNTH